MSNFDPNAILRGAQLTIVGGLFITPSLNSLVCPTDLAPSSPSPLPAYRALQNPSLFEMAHYKQAVLAVLIGVALRLIVAAPILLVKGVLRFLGFFMDLDRVTWDDDIVSGLDFLGKSVLQVPVFLMSAMRYLMPSLDEMFMQSLDWVDRTYLAKHASDDPKTLRALYHPNLRMYEAATVTANLGGKRKKDAAKSLVYPFLIRHGRRAAISAAVYFASFLPVVGRYIYI